MKRSPIEVTETTLITVATEDNGEVVARAQLEAALRCAALRCVR